MGYACPVCAEPHIDARHLANHLAFLAMMGREEYEEWLAEHAPEWEEGGEQELAARVRELAADAEYPQVFEDTTGRIESEHGDDTERSGKLFEESEPRSGSKQASGEGTDPRDGEHSGHAHDHGHDFTQGQGSAIVNEGNMNPEQQEIFAEAQELTREMLESEAGGDETGDESGDENESGDGNESGGEDGNETGEADADGEHADAEDETDA
ncbi:DUF5810 domain-containing protein [Natronomonas sp. EA1]|uniref:DUF5810 domain-containing protein n=1 Tax=Natronomonas sp. EA1 TaxID=3421655 RepID=UPI003EBD05D1